MADRNYIKQKAEDADSAEALKHCVVGGDDLGNSEFTDWIYPGNARSVIWVSTFAVKVQIRGGGGTGLAAGTVRLYTPTGGAVASSTTVAGCIFGNALPHEFRLLNTTASDDCKITWYINY